MNIFFKLLKKHIASVIFVFFSFCVLFGMTYIYSDKKEPVIYAGVICIIISAAYLAFRMSSEYKKYSQLRALEERISYEIRSLPEADGVLEKEYQTLIGILFDKYTESLSRYDKKALDMSDYYTLWAHQIKTPISAMRLLLQSGGVEYQRELETELFRIEQYVEMVMGFLRLEGDGNDFVIASYKLDDIIKSSVRKYSKLFILKKLSLSYEETGASVLTDSKWLSFVVEQIIGNSLKYTDSGKISIYMQGEKTLVIEDTGIGITPEDLPRVFERGYTGYNGRMDKKSTGIGLYLCKRILEKLSHTIRIESEPEVGTRVFIGLESIKLEVE